MTTIPPMKWNSYLAGLVVLGLFSTAAGAIPVYESNRGGEYLISYQGLDRWGAGVVFDSLERPVKIAAGGTAIETKLKQDKTMGYLSFHVIRTLDLYVIGGATDVRLSVFGGEKESVDRDYGAGIRLNIMDHIIQDPILLEDKIRLTGTLQYSETKLGDVWGAKDVFWREKYGALTFSVINDLEGMVLFHPESIALNIGFAYHDLNGYLDYPASRADIDAKDKSYFTAGIEVFWTKRVSIEFNTLLSSDDTKGNSVALHLRF